MTRRLLGLLLLAISVSPTLAAAQGTPMPFVRPYFTENSGRPCANCRLYTYAAGTTTAQPTYTTKALTLGTENTNPIVLDSAGRPNTGYIYLSQTSYRFVLKNSTSSITYWDSDNTPAVPGTSGGVDVDATAGEALAAGVAAYLSDGSGGKTAGRWYKTDADNGYASSAASLVGMVTTAIDAAAAGTVRIAGRITGLSGLTSGTDYYASATDGAITSTAPANTRFIGRSDSTTSIVLGPSSIVSALAQTTRILAGTPYSMTWPNANAGGVFVNNGTGTVSFTDGTGLLVGSSAGTVTYQSYTALASIAGGRLTSQTGVVVPSADQSAVTSIFYTPGTSSTVALWSGTVWTLKTFTEITISVTTCTASTPYDVFLFDNSGTVTSELTAWTNGTTRATAIERLNGVWVKNGANTRRYVGSFYCNATGGQTDDSVTKRFLYNATNRARRQLRVTEATDTWSYGTTTFRQANGATGNKVEVFVGLAESEVSIVVAAEVNNSAGSATQVVSIGEDSVTVGATGQIMTPAIFVGAATQVARSELRKIAALGYHYFAWLEYSNGTGTWFGDNGAATLTQSGMLGAVDN